MQHILPYFVECRKRNLPLLCANPDKKIKLPDGNIRLMQGEVAEKYAAMGGEVIYFGKPYKQAFYGAVPELRGNDASNVDPVEAAALADLTETAEALLFPRVLMIGDALETDVKGAEDVGIDSLLIIETGVHAEEFHRALGENWVAEPERVNSWISAQRLKYQLQKGPTHIALRFQW